MSSIALVTKSGMTFSGKLIRPVVVRRPRDDDRHDRRWPSSCRRADRRRPCSPSTDCAASARRSRGWRRSARCRTPRRSRSGRSGAGAVARRAASSSTNVPSTSVRMKSPAAMIDRSTCVSAAKCTTISACSTSGPLTGASAMSPWTKVCRGSVHHVVQVLAPPGVGQLVERRDVPVGVRRQRVAHEIAADEPGAAGDEDVHHRMPTSELSPSMKRYALGFTGTR